MIEFLSSVLLGLLLILILFLLYIGIPIILPFLLYRWLMRKNKPWLARAIVTVFVLFFGYQVYATYFPPESLFIKEFEYCGGLKMPKSAKIIKKDTEPIFITIHGEFIDNFAMELSRNDYEVLMNKLVADNRYKKDDTLDVNYARVAENKLKQHCTTSFVTMQHARVAICMMADKKTVYVDMYK